MQQSVIRKACQGENLATIQQNNVMNADRPMRIGVEVTNGMYQKVYVCVFHHLVLRLFNEFICFLSCPDGYIRVYTEDSKPLMEYYDADLIPINYVSFAGFNSDVDFYYNCGPH